jgi:DsbC/DsbD-like thiol-disulfide interchange protein
MLLKANDDLRGRCAVVCIALLCIFGWCEIGHAADASSWDAGSSSAVRLVAGTVKPNSGRIIRAGIELRLDPGWKTYWRYPGEAGVPPQIDFAQSENVRTIEEMGRSHLEGCGGFWATL